ncbi:MAG: glycosyltransferase family 2 protein [Chloroflexota bacterium]|nr:MAG: glycosyltransferase family 2 protein [Chloroflexota bacterium]
MDLSVIIVNWNTKNLLVECIDSIYTAPPNSEFDIWVVDNSSTDGSPEIIRNRYPEVNLIVNKENIGFAKANNQAFNQCRGKYILLLNPDTVVKPEAIEKLCRFLNQLPEVGMVGPRLINADKTLQISAFPIPTLSKEFWRLFHLDVFVPYGKYPMKDWDVDTAREVDTLLGACMLIRREALGKSNLFDEEYFIYSEEVDLCARLKKGSWHLYWLPSAVVIHYGSQSTQQVAEDMFLKLYAGKILYFRKHRSKFAVLVYKIILFLATISRLVLTPFALIEEPVKRDEHLVLSNYYRRLLWSLPSL